jgi:hypothetical protein
MSETCTMNGGRGRKYKIFLLENLSGNDLLEK